MVLVLALLGSVLFVFIVGKAVQALNSDNGEPWDVGHGHNTYVNAESRKALAQPKEAEDYQPGQYD